MEPGKEIGMAMVTGLMEESYSLTCVDYRDSLENSLDTIEKCLEAKNSDALYEDVGEWYYDQMGASVRDIMKNLKKELVSLGYKRWEAEKFFEENEDEIKETIYSRDDSDPLKGLLRNTGKIPVRIELISNYDCINSHWLESSGGYSYEESYFGDMADALNLNPRKIKKILDKHGETVTGHFPDKRSRNGKEQVSYEQFYEELINSTCGANLLTYAATIDIGKLYGSNFSLTEIIIPKGNKCGLYSSMQGGGSLMEMELTEDVKLRLSPEDYPYFRLELEKPGRGYDYSIKQVYGVCNSFFGKPFDIPPQPAMPQHT
ncbi:hypothetical protein IR083_18335 [Dysgonomonas sp. GY75]|uniref:hypothetical protein n=1 Tax=Dysgonomonas sp. GY75 TaxID=2780419 RepID=UPI0018837FC9|nr:hypothetical protein [Dysgonomonas sp. GY75]MBF0650784.1 hypothetical protein [Dysgonomonas sp. GY75]